MSLEFYLACKIVLTHSQTQLLTNLNPTYISVPRAVVACSMNCGFLTDRLHPFASHNLYQPMTPISIVTTCMVSNVLVCGSVGQLC